MRTPEQRMEMRAYYASLAYYQRLQVLDERSLRRRRVQIAQQMNGTGCRRSEDECECGGHVKLIVTRNGSDISPPLCPRVIAIRIWRLDIANGRELDQNLMSKLLKEANRE